MGLLEILAILILLCVLLAVGLLAVLLVRTRAGGKGECDAAALSEQVAREVTVRMSEMLRREVTEPVLRAEREGQATQRTELSGTVQTSVSALGATLRESQQATADVQAKRLAELGEALSRRFEEQDKRIAALTESERAFMKELSESLAHRFSEQDRRIEEMQKALQTLLSERMSGLGDIITQRLETMEKQLREMREQNAAALADLQKRNSEQLEQMRATVDEKLQKTLDERISQSFKLVNDRLAEVYRGLGEMQTLAGDVGDLKKVMAGVKTRGILGEIQLGAIIEEILIPEQYVTNAVTIPGSNNRVEYAVKLPGEGDAPVLLPIDAKFPADAYHHLVDAYESGDPVRIKTTTAELETRIKGCAKDIRDKYVETPYTTNFGIMFLPFEGLYAEVVRMGLVDDLQRDYRVSIAGPTTLSALLNSLQMGFRTLAIQKRSGEVWEILGAVKTEFGKFEDALIAAKKHIDQSGADLEKLLSTRTRAMQRKLRSVSELPAEDAARLLETADLAAESTEDPAADT